MTSGSKLRIVDQPRNAVCGEALRVHPDQIHQETSILIIVKETNSLALFILYFLLFYNLDLFSLFFYYF